MKISMKKLSDAAYRGGSTSWWDIYVSDEDTGISEKEVGNIFNDGTNWVWDVSLTEALGIFPMAGGVASSDEAKKAARKHIKECYANWQKKPPVEQDKEILRHHQTVLLVAAQAVGNMTEERKERLIWYVEELGRWFFVREWHGAKSLSCCIEKESFDMELDAIIGVAHFSISGSSVISIAESIRDRVESAIARQENKN